MKLYDKNSRSFEVEVGNINDIPLAVNNATEIGNRGGMQYKFGENAMKMVGTEMPILQSISNIQVDVLPPYVFRDENHDEINNVIEVVRRAEEDGYELLSFGDAVSFFFKWDAHPLVKIPFRNHNGELKVIRFQRDQRGGCGYYVNTRFFGCEEGYLLLGSVGGGQWWGWAFRLPSQ